VPDRPGSVLTGVSYGAVVRHADPRGSFRELWRASADPSGGFPVERSGTVGAHFVQANLSVSAAGVLRGLHLHRRQLDRWVVATGRAFVALVDVRPPLAGDGPPRVETRQLEADDWVEIPVGVAHGFLALEPLELVYFVTAEFDDTDEHGFAWDDPVVGVPWPDPIPGTPDGRPILSERDRGNPPLAELVARLRG